MSAHLQPSAGILPLGNAETSITVANRPFHSNPRFDRPTGSQIRIALASRKRGREHFAVGIHKPLRGLTGWCMATAKVTPLLRGENGNGRCEGDAAMGFECNGLWLLKNSISRNWSKKLCARMPYKRRSRFWWTFATPSRRRFFQKRGFSTATPVLDS